MQRLDSRLREVVAYEMSDRKSEIFKSTKNGVVYFFLKNYESLLSPAN